MSHDDSARDAPTGRPTELEGTGVLNVCGLAAAGARVAVPAYRALAVPAWALLPLVEGARAPEAQTPRGSRLSDDGIPIRTGRVVVDIEGFVDQTVAFSVQDVDDGFRQRRWLVSHFAACWNHFAARTDRADPRVADEASAHYRELLSDAIRESSMESPLADPVELDRRLLTLLAAVKTLEAWVEAGDVEQIDLKLIHESAKADIQENRPYGILEALSYDAASASSGSAEWHRVARADGYRASNFTTRDFFRWAAEASGYNERFVRAALAESEPIRQILEGEQSTKGKKGSVFPEVLEVLRARGRARLEASPIRTLWAQTTTGTTIDVPVPERRTLAPVPHPQPAPGKKRK